ncbi:MAG: hypothetical protein QY316_02365 [Thermodesulfobacteriota bacterium]|nr:MAG: hypothetical protein QY316_02365 [Thermodesulfobacteriota bacterium]
MKNPIEKILKRSSITSEMYHKLSKLRCRLDKDMDAIGKKFKKDLAKAEKIAKKKLKAAEQLKVWKKGGYEKLASKVQKKADALMRAAKKDYKLALAKLRK